MSVSSAESDKEYCYPVDEILVHRRSSPLPSLIRRVSMNVYRYQYHTPGFGEVLVTRLAIVSKNVLH